MDAGPPHESLELHLSRLERSEDTSESNALPRLGSETARESESAKAARVQQLRAISTSKARILIAPPTKAPSTSRLEEGGSSRNLLLRGNSSRKASFLRVGKLVPALERRSEADSGGKDLKQVLEEAEYEHIRKKQNDTVACFNYLCNLANQPSSMKAVLRQIHNVLYEATYRSPQQLSEISSAIFTKQMEELHPIKGFEFFSLIQTTEQEIREIDKKRKIAETGLSLELSIQSDLRQTLDSLQRGLLEIQTTHAKNTERLEEERQAVLSLEREYVALGLQEMEKKSECDVLEQELALHKQHFSTIQSRSLDLKASSTEPLKKYMQRKKEQEIRDKLRGEAQAIHSRNEELLNELEALEAKGLTLEAQCIADQERNIQAHKELKLMEGVLEETRLRMNDARRCHTPRPQWENIISQTPELITHRFEWESNSETPSAISQEDQHFSYNDEEKDEDHREEEEEEQAVVGAAVALPQAGKTQQLVREMLLWLNRLQSENGLNQHLSKIWHDIEEARVALNNLHHQLGRAVKKYNRSTTRRLYNKKAKNDYVVALGTTEDVPRFLRHQGKVKNRNLKKVELEKIIRSVWAEKTRREKRSGSSFPVEEVLYEKLKRKFGFQPLIAEWGYNIVMSLSNYAWDAEIELFLLCLTGAVSDQVYEDQDRMITSCRSLLLKLCATYGNESFVKEHRVFLKDAVAVIRRFFPRKTAAQLQAVENALMRDVHKEMRGSDSILYIEDILPLDAAYPCSYFVKTIRAQQFKEIQDYYGVLNGQLQEQDADDTGELPLSTILDVMMQVDSLSDPVLVSNALTKAMGVKTKKELKMSERVDYTALVKRMNASLLKFNLNYDPDIDVVAAKRAAEAATVPQGMKESNIDKK